MARLATVLRSCARHADDSFPPAANGISALFGGIWGAVSDVDTVATYARSPSTGLALGSLYGFALWFVNVGLVIPLWVIYVIGVAMTFPYLTQVGALMPLMGHLLWGRSSGSRSPSPGSEKESARQASLAP